MRLPFGMARDRRQSKDKRQSMDGRMSMDRRGSARFENAGRKMRRMYSVSDPPGRYSLVGSALIDDISDERN